MPPEAIRPPLYCSDCGSRLNFVSRPTFWGGEEYRIDPCPVCMSILLRELAIAKDVFEDVSLKLNDVMEQRDSLREFIEDYLPEEPEGI
jgi:hypothetical protein